MNFFKTLSRESPELKARFVALIILVSLGFIYAVLHAPQASSIFDEPRASVEESAFESRDESKDRWLSNTLWDADGRTWVRSNHACLVFLKFVVRDSIRLWSPNLIRFSKFASAPSQAPPELT
jgi:hypothetical protein